MKKAAFVILFSVICSFAFGFRASAQETSDIAKAINSTTMPTDAEIMQVIDKYNFDGVQKDTLFKETKRQLEELYSGKNPSVPSAELNNNDNNQEQAQSTKKYSNHPPLHTKQKYGPQRNK